MKFKLLTNPSSHPRLVMIMAGWGMDARPFEGLTAPGYDVAVAWDYNDDDLDADLSAYGEIVVVAWSYGVAMAARWLDGPGRNLPVTRRVAVNGTLHPVDDNRGIPAEIFRGTLDNLDEDNLARFYRRMAGGAKGYREFRAVMPARTIESLRAELARIGSLSGEIPAVMWDEAFVADNDAVIPTANQRAAWTDGCCRVTGIGGAHLPDFQDIINRSVVDKGTVAERFGQAAGTYADHAGVQRVVAERLMELLPADCPERPRVLELGAGTGILTRMVDGRLHPASMTLVDLNMPRVAVSAPAEAVEADAEAFIARVPDGSCDMIVSASTIQWFNSIPAFIGHARRVLVPGGILAVATYGQENFRELDRLFPGRRRFMADSEWKALIEGAGMQLVAWDAAIVETAFDGVGALMAHLRATGVNAPTVGANPVTAARTIMRSYPAAPDGSVTLTYNPVYIILRKR